MKKVIVFLFLVAIFLTGCNTVPKSDVVQRGISKPDVSGQCEGAGGAWLSEYNECEYAGREWCDEKGGEWNECESACRHDPEAEICTLQCVPVCKFTEEKPEPEPEPEDLPVDYSYGLFVEYTGANIGSVRGSKKILFGIDSHNKIVSPGGSFDIAGKVGECNANGIVNIKMGGNIEYNKSSKQWMFHLMLRPAINNYIWECAGMVMDNSMEEWDAPFIMPFDDGATLEMPGLVFKLTLQDIPLWPVPLI